MKKIVKLFAFFYFTLINCQSIVTFENNVFYFNGQPFFPIGWYECNSFQEMNKIKNYGGNTVLVLWEFLIQENGGEYTPSGYLSVLNSYLQYANSIGLKVVVQLPFKKQFSDAQDSANAITDNLFINTIVPEIKNNSALLGWYIADEPEMVNNWKTEPYSKLQYWYQLIKSIDPNHPIFVCVCNGYILENQTVRPVGPQNPENPFSHDRFFDVLMIDIYASFKSEPSLYRLDWFDQYAMSLFDAFQLYGDSLLPAMSSILVAQGFIDSKMRAPTIDELKYELVSCLMYSQIGWWDRSKNLGGMFFWRYGASNDTCKNNVTEVVKYFIGNSFDKIIQQQNINFNLINDPDYPNVFSFIRFWNNSYYLFVINRSDAVAAPSISIEINDYTICKELTIPFGSYVIKKLIPEGDLVILRDRLLPRDAKIYRIFTEWPIELNIKIFLQGVYR
ncbi:MAG: DUF4434 domain-containing protein [Ignavibacteriales bacterium]|nr:DUF4434 domain-containing protein [Ignavibacteriales bacterium]